MIVPRCENADSEGLFKVTYNYSVAMSNTWPNEIPETVLITLSLSSANGALYSDEYMSPAFLGKNSQLKSESLEF